MNRFLPFPLRLSDGGHETLEVAVDTIQGHLSVCWRSRLTMDDSKTGLVAARLWEEVLGYADPDSITWFEQAPNGRTYWITFSETPRLLRGEAGHILWPRGSFLEPQRRLLKPATMPGQGAAGWAHDAGAPQRPIR